MESRLPTAVLGRRRLAAFAACAWIWSASLLADPVPVRHPEGLVHGFLSLRTLDGALVANGDLIQNAHADQVTTRLVFHFKDGSVHDETSVFSQRGTFRLLRNHLVQKGPTFPTALDLTIDCATGDVNVRSTDEHGKEKTATRRMELPTDLANGMTLTLLKNMRPGSPPPTLSMLVATPKPRIVTLITSAVADDTPFSTGSQHRKALHYVVKIDIGGLSGLVAPLIGKQPPDTHVWILQGEAPAFVKSEGPMYFGGPIWRIELVSPVWSLT